MRKIIHVDMDAFYASVEQRDHPELKGKPVVVGGDPHSRGVVAAASYEARTFGIHSAMPCAQAHRLCAHAVFVPPRIAHYREVSKDIHGVFRQVTDIIEPLSLDEAYLDVTANKLGEPLAVKVARWLKNEIRAVTGLTASAGVGNSKLVAKIASDMDKPDGLVVIPPERVLDFLAPLPVKKLWGVGPATEARLHDLGLKTVADVRACDEDMLTRRFGKHGALLARQARGEDDREVSTDRTAKSRGSETTFSQDVLSLSVLSEVLLSQAEGVAASLQRMQLRARTITLKVRYDDFTTITRSRSIPQATRDERTLHEVSTELLASATEAGQRPVRLIGLSASGFVGDGDPEQLWFQW